MSAKKYATPLTRQASPEELGLALRCVLYDMLMLAGSLVNFGAWQEKRTYRGQRWVEAKLAESAMLAVSRSLFDFLVRGRAMRQDDITIRDFQGTPLEEKYLPLHLKSFWEFVNKRCAHLTWERAKEGPLPTFGDISGTPHSAEDCSFWTLAQSCLQAQALLDAGQIPEVPRPAKYLRELNHQLKQLGLPPLQMSENR